MPTWARQAWKGLAVQRPCLCLELLQELIAKVRSSSSFGDEEIKHTPIHTVSRGASLALVEQLAWPAGLSAVPAFAAAT